LLIIQLQHLGAIAERAATINAPPTPEALARQAAQRAEAKRRQELQAARDRRAKVVRLLLTVCLSLLFA
jgi:hypothetical protein